jgi:hypothetical protein
MGVEGEGEGEGDGEDCSNADVEDEAEDALGREE